MPDNVVPIEKNLKHETTPALCPRCLYSWVNVAPLAAGDLPKLSCPECGHELVLRVPIEMAPVTHTLASALRRLNELKQQLDAMGA